MKNYITFICLGAAAAAALFAAARLRKRKRDEDKRPNDCIDGGVRHYHDTEAPKSVESRVITRFECEGNYSFTDENGNENVVRYTSCAISEGNVVRCTHKEYDRFGYSYNRSFTADGAVMDDLYEIFAKHELARYNGISYTVSGLPPGYGSKLNIDFDSGENVYSYNNQTSFLSDEFGVDLSGVLKRHADAKDSR